MRILITIAIFSIVTGTICGIVAARVPVHVDAEGFLNEPFAWIAISRLLLTAAGLSLVTATGLWTMRRLVHR